ncbi:hypothetical protein [Streptomyces sp.]|uniref:hypothetical protein n=1 Tax=Streptomyces sp. TaxID=1931 RepID=UPI0028110E84|nr:hypothetical protein [Streptomyces sp.]
MNADVRLHIEKLLREGHSDLAVHKATGAARTTVARHRKHLGLPGYRTTADSPACRHGHPFPQNRAHDSNGWLYCRACSRIRSRAYQARTYIPAQPDWAAIERAAAGDPPHRLTSRERAAAIQQCATWQHPADITAERIHCSPRTVHRHRQRAAA